MGVRGGEALQDCGLFLPEGSGFGGGLKAGWGLAKDRWEPRGFHFALSSQPAPIEYFPEVIGVQGS